MIFGSIHLKCSSIQWVKHILHNKSNILTVTVLKTALLKKDKITLCRSSKSTSLISLSFFGFIFFLCFTTTNFSSFFCWSHFFIFWSKTSYDWLYHNLAGWTFLVPNSFFHQLKQKLFYLLKLATASYTRSCSCVSDTYLLLGIRSQIIELSWVLPCKHFSSKLSSQSSAKIGFNFIIISNGKPGPGLYLLVPFAPSWWNLHQLSFPSGQCG